MGAGSIFRLFEKAQQHIPFLERAYQLLRPGGQMVFIISDAYNAAKYARKSHEFFLNNTHIARLDFCSDIPLKEQQEFVRLVDAILAEFERHGYPLPPEAVACVAELELEIEERVTALYS